MNFLIWIAWGAVILVVSTFRDTWAARRLYGAPTWWEAFLRASVGNYPLKSLSVAAFLILAWPVPAISLTVLVLRREYPKLDLDIPVRFFRNRKGP